jgi:hypothetical protein
LKNHSGILNCIQTCEKKLIGFKIFKSVFLFSVIVSYIFSASVSVAQDQKKDKDLKKLTIWGRGVKIQSRTDTSGYAYLWFYEWHLFDAVRKGENTPASCAWKWTTDKRNTIAQMDAKWLKMSMKATKNGADMTLQITNTSDYDWPEIAAIIPCFNPGGPFGEVKRNPIFLDKTHENTYFPGLDGLELLKGQHPTEIHFAHELRPEIMKWKKEQPDGNFAFSFKWPNSDRDAYAGLIIRESSDHKWTMGIAWESFISAQGHNPWTCMHLSIKVGPLAKGQTKTIRGKMYLFKGTKEDCLKYFKNDFPTGALLKY